MKTKPPFCLKGILLINWHYLGRNISRELTKNSASSEASSEDPKLPGTKGHLQRIFTDPRIMIVISLYIQEVILHVDGRNLPRATDLHDYPTKHAVDYHLPAHHLTLYQKKLSYAGQKLFNLLPAEMKILKGKKLKKSLNEWLTSTPFYTFE
ncbi:hypothetical protein J6590_058073 [Homalodisca vitripennis]|nr:hypothetical protein J6590_058073 [Homalodisca vitripennis]